MRQANGQTIELTSNPRARVIMTWDDNMVHSEESHAGSNPARRIEITRFELSAWRIVERQRLALRGRNPCRAQLRFPQFSGGVLTMLRIGARSQNRDESRMAVQSRKRLPLQGSIPCPMN